MKRAALLLVMLLLAGVTSGASPSRLVSMAPNLTDTVYALGAGSNLVGVTTFCRVEEPGPVRVGGYLDPDIETIVRLQPDLVLTQPNPTLLQAMAAFEIKVAVVQNQWSTLADIRQSILHVARLIGRTNEGARLTADLDATLARIREAGRAGPHPGVLLVIAKQPGGLVVAGPGSHLDELIRVAGGTNAVSRGGPYPNLDLETLLQARPEVIIDTSGGAADWQRFETLPAVRQGRVYNADPSRLVQPGPGVGESAALLFSLIHRVGTP